MKEYTLFSYSFLFGDHFAKVSDQAKLYYIKLNFYADNGFVANPFSVLDSMSYDKGVYYELVNNGDILALESRNEVFITSYFVHNHIKPINWLKSPFAVYWKGKLYIKQNGIATFKPQNQEKPTQKDFDPLVNVKEPKEDTEFEIPDGEWSADELAKGFNLFNKEQAGMTSDFSVEQLQYLKAFKEYMYRGRE